MPRLLIRTTTLCLLALLPLVAAGCRSSSNGPTQDFPHRTLRTIFVHAPPSVGISGDQAELVRRTLMGDLRDKGYGVTSTADVRLLPVVEEWGRQLTISARLLGAGDHLLWRDRVTIDGFPAGTAPAARVATAVRKLLRSLPDAGR